MTTRFSRVAVGILVIALLVLPRLARGAPRKLAVLVSTVTVTADNLLYHSEYWYDLVLTYNLLTENGFTANDVYVLYADGSDFSQGTNITDLPATRQVVESVFGCLRDGSCSSPYPPELDPEDFLLVAWMGHGYSDSAVVAESCGAASGATMYLDTHGGEWVCDVELASWADQAAMEFRRRAFLFATCSAGGIVYDLAGDTTAVLASCPEHESDHSCTFTELNGAPVEHREWVFLIEAALRQIDVSPVLLDVDQDVCEHHVLGPSATAEADLNRNNLVSLQEAFDWAAETALLTTAPELGNRDTAMCAHLYLPEPARDVEAFSMDHPRDRSTVPSNEAGVAWWDGPDLWVRDSVSCFDNSHVEPVFGDSSYLCARVHNIGCTDLLDLEIAFSWVESTGWADPARWNPVGTATVNVEVGSSQTTSPVEWTDVPLPGSYCLHAVVSAAGDPAGEPRANWDNNTTQINVSVLGSGPGAWAWWPFLIENWSEAGEEDIDLEIDLSLLAPGAEVFVELPGVLGAQGTVPPGVTLSEDEGWTVLEFGAARGVVEVRGVSVAVGESRRAVVRMKLPDPVPTGGSVLRIAELLNGEEVGGIVFEARTVNLEETAWRTLVMQARMLGKLALALGEEEVAAQLESLAHTAGPGQYEELLEAFRKVGARYEDLPEAKLSKLVAGSDLYATRFKAAAAAFRVTAGAERRGAEPLKTIVEHAKENALYTWLILNEHSRGE